jgi:hypothetical protein
VTENAGYGQGVDHSLRFTDRGQRSPDDDEYSYAYNNTVPFVKTNKQDMEGRPNDNQGKPLKYIGRISPLLICSFRLYLPFI